MAYPITTKPYLDYYGGIPPGPTFLEQRQRYVQVKPYDLNMPYFRNSRYYGDVTVWGYNPGLYASFCAYTSASDADTYPLWPGSTRAVDLTTTCLNKARAKFVQNLGDSAQIAANLAEGQQMCQMLELSLRRIGRSYSLLRRGKLLSAARALGLTEDDAVVRRYAGTSSRRISRKASAIFLEMHFGWIPIVNDIDSAINFLSNQQVAGTVRGSCSTVIPWRYTRTAGSLNNPLYFRGEHSTKVIAKVQCDYKVTNPNLYLANRLGFINIASVVWEVIPFSFLVDWFTNVGQFVAQFGEFYGLSVYNAFHTTCVEDYVDSSLIECYPADTVYRANQCSGMSTFTERKLGIPDVRLEILPAKRLSISRALTAISLLVQLGIARSK